MENSQTIPTDGVFKGMTAQQARDYISDVSMVAEHCDDPNVYRREKAHVTNLSHQYHRIYGDAK